MSTNFKKLSVVAVMTIFSSVSFSASVPSGWVQQGGSGEKIKLYKLSSQEVYAQVVNFSRGARVEVVQGEPQWRSPYYYYYRQTANDWWNWSSSEVFSMVTGNCFNDRINPTTMSFSMKSDGKVHSGSDRINDRQIEFFDGVGVSVFGVNPHDDSRILSTHARSAIGGYSPSRVSTPGGLRG